MKYGKAPLNLQSQLDHIKIRYNIKCNDKKLALFYLEHHNYYRLRGYWLYFETKGLEATFKDIINLYNFDIKLRLILIKHLQLIEISIKSIFAYTLATKYDNPHVLLDSRIFKNRYYYDKGVAKLKSSFSNSDELFASHYKNKYDENLPPIWACVELMTFGEISKWIKNLNDNDTKLIAKGYGIKSVDIFKSFLYHLTEIRNKSPHNSRVWNKIFSHKFTIPKEYKNIFDTDVFKLSHTMLVLKILLENLTDDSILDEVTELSNNHNISIGEMGLNDKILKALR